MITIGVIADTHIPDRSRALDPAMLARFRAAQVQAILHAGDVCIPRVLEELGEIAPVFAVRGNRDIWALRGLPLSLELEFGGVLVGLLHGDGSLASYLLDKARFLVSGIHEQHFTDRAAAHFSRPQVIVYGHTHIPVNRFQQGRLIFNPGSACCPHPEVKTPSAGLLHIGAEGTVQGEIFTWQAE
jgi:putative phosphoesterase